MAYLSAWTLGVDQLHYDLLLKAREAFASGNIVRNIDIEENSGKEGEFYLNMDNVKSRNGCGTVGCIAGWMLHEYRKSNPNDNFYNELWFKLVDDDKHPMNDLFFPYELPHWDQITPQEVVKAIDNYLKTGKPKWKKIVKIKKEIDGGFFN